MTKSSCIICESPDPLPTRYQCQHRVGDGYSLLQCPRCGCGRTDPFPTEAEIDRLYANDTYRAPQGVRFIKPMEVLVRQFRRKRWQRIRKFIPNGSLLDIGCGGGYFLAYLREKGWNVAGVEVNESMAQCARDEYGIRVHVGNIDHTSFPAESFDVITMYHVLEHIPDPDRTIQECFRMLRPGGLLVIAVPNFGSWQARATKASWFHLDVPHHLHHFTARGLKLFLERNRFNVQETRHFSLEQNPIGWLQSTLNWSGFDHNLLYDFLKTRALRRSFSWSLLPILASLPVTVPLSVAAAMVEAAVNGGGTIETYALKPL